MEHFLTREFSLLKPCSGRANWPPWYSIARDSTDESYRVHGPEDFSTLQWCDFVRDKTYGFFPHGHPFSLKGVAPAREPARPALRDKLFQ